MPKITKISATSVGLAINPLELKAAGIEVGDSVVISAKKNTLVITKVGK
jgi:hypothetical protein